jgi:hypothetical protein
MAASRIIITGPTSFVVGPITDDDIDETVLNYAISNQKSLSEAALDLETPDKNRFEVMRWNDLTWFAAFSVKMMRIETSG